MWLDRGRCWGTAARGRWCSLVRIHFIIVVIRWAGLAPREFEFPFPGSLTSTFLDRGRCWATGARGRLMVFNGELDGRKFDSHGQPLLHRNVQRFRGGLVFKAHRLVYHSTLGLRVITKKKRRTSWSSPSARASTPCRSRARYRPPPWPFAYFLFIFACDKY